MRAILIFTAFVTPFFGVTRAVAQCADVPADMVAWWPGQNNANNIANTSSQGTMLNGATFAPGLVGDAFSFNSSNAAVMSVPHSVNLDFGPTSALTVSLWVYKTGSAGVMHILGRRVDCGPANQNFQMVLVNGVLSWGGAINTGFAVPVDVAGDLDNQWAHLTGSYDPAAGIGGTWRIYLNGAKIGERDNSGSIGAINPSLPQPPFLVGNSVTCAGGFEGLIDEVEIFARALSDAEILALYNANAAGSCTVDVGPVAGAVNASPNPTNPGQNVNLTATVDASNTGFAITRAEYSLDNGASWLPMSASDGSFDGVTEAVTASFTAPAGPAAVDLCVRGRNTQDIDGAESCTSLNINQAPTVSANGPYQVVEGGAVGLTATGDDPDGNPLALTYAWDLDNNGSFETLVQNPNFSAAGLDGPTSATVKVRVTDTSGLSATDQTTVQVLNAPPSAVFANSSGTISEGGSAILAFSSQADAAAADVNAGFSYSYDCDGDGSFEQVDLSAATFDCAFSDDGSFTAKGRIKDKDNGFTDYTAAILVNNLAPVVGTITAPTEPLQAPAAIAVSAAFFDAGLQDTHTAVWDWGDATQCATVTDPECSLSGTNGAGTVTGSHTYGTAGVYEVTLTVTDNGNLDGVGIYQFIVVYDPSAGFVTGAGKITSPPGAYAADPAATGTAHFGFNSKYHNGASVPTGNTQFKFKAADLKFKSTSYEWLVIAGSKAQFKGEGTINGSGTYQFILTGIDGAGNGNSGGADKFRIKITEQGGGLVYDNKVGASENGGDATELDSGNIRIQQSGAAKAASTGEVTPDAFGLENNAPNPFNPSTTIRFALPQSGPVSLTVYSVQGQKVATLLSNQFRHAGRHAVEFNAQGLASGLYFYRLEAGAFQQVKKMSFMK